MKLEVGKYYKSAAGDKWGPVRMMQGRFFATSDHDDEGWYYEPYGRVMGLTALYEDTLVAEWDDNDSK
jgi:hypothetical protein